MTKRNAQLGLFLALALILAYVESLIPLSFGIPGIKLGLPNLIVVLLLYCDVMNRSFFQGIIRNESVRLSLQREMNW